MSCFGQQKEKKKYRDCFWFLCALEISLLTYLLTHRHILISQLDAETVKLGVVFLYTAGDDDFVTPGSAAGVARSVISDFKVYCYLLNCLPVAIELASLVPSFCIEWAE